jgi:hypothetical protein
MGSNGKRKQKRGAGAGGKSAAPNGKATTPSTAPEADAKKKASASEAPKPASSAPPASKSTAPPAPTEDPDQDDDRDSSPDDGDAGDDANDANDAKKKAEEKPKGAPWGDPIAAFEAKWTAFESKLVTYVLLAQLGALVAWVLLKGVSQPVVAGGDIAGKVFRSVVGMAIVGPLAWFFSKKQPEKTRSWIAFGGMVAGVAIGVASKDAGAAYFDNIKGWLQEASLLTMTGGLRGVGTRLTLWLALLGGSLATASGKHIHIDVIFRFLPKRLRVGAAVINYSAAMLVCFAAVWGFFDHIAIEDFGSNADATVSDKIGHVAHEVRDDLFLMRKQIGLDLKSVGHVLGGGRYDQWMSGSAWNAWVKDAGFEDHFPQEKVAQLLVPEDTATHSPFVLSPDGRSTRGLLVHTLSMVFPFGLFAIGLRFLLRAIMAISGHLSVDPDEAHKEDLKSAASPIVVEGDDDADDSKGDA